MKALFKSQMLTTMYLKIFIITVFLFIIGHLSLANVSAEPNCENPSAVPIGDIPFCIDKLKNIADQLAPAQENNKKQLADLNAQITSIKNQITGISNQLDDLQEKITQRENDLTYTRKVFEEKTTDQYKFLRVYDPILPFLSADSAAKILQELVIRQKVTNEDRLTIEDYANEIASLSQDKDSLEKNKTNLASLQSKIDSQAKFLSSEVAKVDSYLTELSSKQQELLAAKSGSFIASVGDSELADDYNASIKGFREAAPGGSFAVFSFGGYTHRKGMSQYGARGRAQSGQNTNQILQSYYSKTPVNKDTGGNITVSGVGDVNFEDYYLMGIAEMPSSWHPEALKAQAIAARTYAYRYKVQGTAICTTEACQVFNQGKANNPPDTWRQAVQATRGQVLEDVVTYYSSTSGGFSTTSGWDTTDGSGGANFFDKSYEKIGGSPWAYKAWYRQGYTNSGATCGKNNPWLNNEEFTDIINAAIVLKAGSDSRVTSTSTSCWGGNPYSFAELRDKGGVGSVSSVVVSQGNGSTNNVTINGSITLTGDEFKQAFNLRAPGYLMVPQKGFAFFNIEKK